MRNGTRWGCRILLFATLAIVLVSLVTADNGIWLVLLAPLVGMCVLSMIFLHNWFRSLKQHANKDHWDKIADLSFHDLRHDFAHRAREAGWTLEEVAYYLGHVTKKGTLAIQTTARYTQVSREHVKEKLSVLKK